MYRQATSSNGLSSFFPTYFFFVQQIILGARIPITSKAVPCLDLVIRMRRGFFQRPPAFSTSSTTDTIFIGLVYRLMPQILSTLLRAGRVVCIEWYRGLDTRFNEILGWKTASRRLLSVIVAAIASHEWVTLFLTLRGLASSAAPQPSEGSLFSC
ncbi:hypothetical protein BJV78DRAFT_513270 [Lactifluus subvellereus]|nr:hypothetical protein BJV78DRAFT_513270 [Lactifluus subvellereus]